MKIVIISVILLSLVTCGVIFNIFYVKNTTEKIIELTEDLPENIEGFYTCAQQIDEISEIWHKHKTVITFLVDYREVENADTAFNDLLNCVKGGDYEQYLISRDSFVHYLTRLIEMSVISAENIL